MAINTLPRELLTLIFEYAPPQQNVGSNARVCRLWRALAADVAKNQILNQFLPKVQNFLRMVAPRRLDEFCPLFAKSNREKLPFTAIHRTSLTLFEKHKVRIASFFRINPESPHMPREELKGKIFAELHHQKNQLSYVFELDQGLHFFPIELFNLTVNGPNFEITGEKNSGTVCFPLRGRLIELTVEQRHVAPGFVCWDDPGTFWNGIPGANRNTAVTVNLKQNDGYVWASDCYIADRDAGPKELNLPKSTT